MRNRILSEMTILFLCALSTMVAVASGADDGAKAPAADVPGPSPETAEAIQRWWKAGRTLPLETTARYPLNELRVRDDTGVNVLIDMAHKCDFFTLWTLGGPLNARGIRTIGSHAVLDSVLTPGSPCRVRIPVAPGEFPFAWWEAPKFNVVLTEGGRSDPGYLPEERAALRKFIHDGGGLIVSGSWLRDDQRGSEWSLNAMLAEYGASVLAGAEDLDGQRWPALQVDPQWEVVLKGGHGKPIHARRSYGKGRIVLFASSAVYRFERRNREETDRKCDALADAVRWAAAGSPPVGGDKRFPMAMGGAAAGSIRSPRNASTASSASTARTRSRNSWRPSKTTSRPSRKTCTPGCRRRSPKSRCT